jgi:hypothetical protein
LEEIARIFDGDNAEVGTATKEGFAEEAEKMEEVGKEGNVHDEKI